MEKRPLRPKSAAASAHGGPGNEESGPPEAADPAPFPPPQDNDWSALGATRVLPGPESGSGNTELRAEDTAVPSPALPEDEVQKATGVLGDFRLLKKVGEGAMGFVYKAHQGSFDRDVALKVLFKRIGNQPKLVERLRREALIMGRLDHPNIVRGYGVDEADGWHFVIMEYIDGDSLEKWLARLGKLGVGDAIHITLACARALDYAHSQGLIHRDIKPDNVLLTPAGGVKVADFGMVKDLDEELSLTQTGHAVGTPWYMPLEQARNAKDTDGRCDIYALGCMLYCLLTGQPPFTGRTLVEVIQAKELGTFAPVRQFNPNVPERLDLIIAKMAAKHARHRYQNCADIIKDLESLSLENPSVMFLTKEVLAPEASPPADAAPAASSDAPASKPKESADIWYLRFRTPAGQIMVRKLTTAQVLKLVQEDRFDPTAAASRHPSEGFRALATYREFESAVLGRLSKKAADENTVRYRNLYKKIEEQERRRERPIERNISTTSYWLGIGFKVGGIVLGVGLLLFLLWYFGTTLGK
jgi:serine/threonine-protein kinase